MAHVARLALSHFRSHRSTRLALDGRPVAVFGPNGAGKTNLLEAVSLLSPGRGMRRAAAEDLTRRQEAIGWRVAAETSHGRAVELRAEAGRSRTTQIDGKAAPQVALARLMRVLWLTPAMDRLWIEGAEGRRRFLDRMTLSFDPSHAEGAVAYEKVMRDRNRLLRDGVRDARWYEALEAQMAGFGARIHDRRRDALARLVAAQEDGPFPAAALDLIGPEDDEPLTEEALAEALAASRMRDMAAGRTLVGPHRSDLEATYAAKGVPARLCSTGEQKALLISLVLANARALRAESGEAPVLLLDEVAAHLDEDRRGALYDAVCGLGGQAWMTGTGPELFAQLGERAARLSVTEEDGHSAVAAA